MADERVLELRVYTLKPGTRAAFHQRLEEHVRPMLARHGITVVHAGPSLHDEHSYCLIRTFASLDERKAALDAFYGSAEWLEQHDTPVMAMIDHYNTCVLSADGQLIEAMKCQL